MQHVTVTLQRNVTQHFSVLHNAFLVCPAGSPLCGGDVAFYVFDILQPSLPTPFYSVLVSISVVMALSTIFHSTILPITLRFLTLFFLSYLCLIGPFNYISLYESLLQPGCNH